MNRIQPLKAAWCHDSSYAIVPSENVNSRGGDSLAPRSMSIRVKLVPAGKIRISCLWGVSAFERQVCVLGITMSIHPAKGAAGGSPEGRRLLGWVLLAFLPAAVLDDWIEAVLFGPWPIVIAWAICPLAIFLVSARVKSKARPP